MVDLVVHGVPMGRLPEEEGFAKVRAKFRKNLLLLICAQYLSRLCVPGVSAVGCGLGPAHRMKMEA